MNLKSISLYENMCFHQSINLNIQSMKLKSSATSDTASVRGKQPNKPMKAEDYQRIESDLQERFLQQQKQEDILRRQSWGLHGDEDDFMEPVIDQSIGLYCLEYEKGKNTWHGFYVLQSIYCIYCNVAFTILHMELYMLNYLRCVGEVHT